MSRHRVAYLRVSTDQQADSGLGLEAQRISCKDYAEKSGHEVEHTFLDEGLSGSLALDKRPGMLKAIASLSKGNILLVAKRDRLGRDPLVVAMIEAAIARKGKRVGHIPFGFKLSDDGVHLESNELEITILNQMQALRNKGFSIRRIAEEMNNRSAFNRGRSKWSHSSVHRVMKIAA